MQIILDRFYRRRDGQKVGPSKPSGQTSHPWMISGSSYRDDGRYTITGESQLDIVSVWAPGSPEKLMCDCTSDDYVRGVANTWNEWKFY